MLQPCAAWESSPRAARPTQSGAISRRSIRLLQVPSAEASHSATSSFEVRVLRNILADAVACRVGRDGCDTLHECAGAAGGCG